MFATMMIVASFALTGPVAPQDSSAVSADAAAPAPKPKHGGLFGKVRGLAGNKLVQTAVKAAACNMVPGGQVIAGALDVSHGSSAGVAQAAISGTAAGGTCANGGFGNALGAAPDATMPGAAIPGVAALGGMPKGGLMAGVMGGSAGMTALAGMPGTAGGAGMPAGMKLNEPAAAKCLGVTVPELRDLMNPTPDAGGAKRAEALQRKLVKRAQNGTQVADMQACADAWRQ
jgi:hypothetical protein